jgi:large subunit ribosomal protein L24
MQVQSSKPRKQRKWRANAPLHKKKEFCSSMLSKELKQNFKINAMQVRKGDTVKVMRGDLKGASGSVIRVDIKKGRVYIDNLTMKKSDGKVVERPFQASNLQITALVLEDKRRKGILERKAGG